MKIHLRFTIIMITAFIITSCNGPNGPDGLSGDAYVAVVSSDGTLVASTGSFGSTPSTAYTNSYYYASPGTYSYRFTAISGTSSRAWTGTYSVSVNQGEKGGAGKIFWEKGDAGKDGADKYYKLDCTYSSGCRSYSKDEYWKRALIEVDTLIAGRLYKQDFSDEQFIIRIESQFK